MVQGALAAYAEEKEIMKKNDSSSLRWLWRISGKKRRKIFWLMLLQMLLGVFSVGFVWLLRGLIDAAAGGNEPRFRGYAAGLLGLTLLQLALRAMLRYL